MATETKQSNLEKAFERKNALNLNLTTEPLICDVCDNEYYYDTTKEKCIAGNIIKCQNLSNF